MTWLRNLKVYWFDRPWICMRKDFNCLVMLSALHYNGFSLGLELDMTYFPGSHSNHQLYNETRVFIFLIWWVQHLSWVVYDSSFGKEILCSSLDLFCSSLDLIWWIFAAFSAKQQNRIWKWRSTLQRKSLVWPDYWILKVNSPNPSPLQLMSVIRVYLPPTTDSFTIDNIVYSYIFLVIPMATMNHLVSVVCTSDMNFKRTVPLTVYCLCSIPAYLELTIKINSCYLSNSHLLSRGTPHYQNQVVSYGTFSARVQKFYG